MRFEIEVEQPTMILSEEPLKFFPDTNSIAADVPAGRQATGGRWAAGGWASERPLGVGLRSDRSRESYEVTTTA